MGETFYSVLGVTDDAEPEQIRSAYRDRVKETHPDVSEDPDASRVFRRVTTARDVLLDESERRRYDRLGHVTYVRRYVEDSTWEASGSDTSRQSPGARARASRTTTTASTTTYTSQEGHAETSQTSTGTTRSDGGYATEDWQQASEAYRRSSHSYEVEDSSVVRDLFGMLQKAGPWVVVYVVFVFSAVTTAWSSIVASGAGVTTLAVFSSLVLVFVVLFSILYLFVELHP